MGEIINALLVLAALAAVYALVFRSFFGKRLGRSARNPAGRAWSAALLGGFAAASIAETFPSGLELTLILAAVVGLSCGLSGKAGPMSLPAAILGCAAALATAVRIWITAPTRGTAAGYLAITACMVVLYVLGELVRVFTFLPLSAITRSGTSVSAGERALGYFASLELADFLIAPGGAGVLEWATTGLPAVVVWLAVILLPIVFGMMAGVFLTMLNTGVALILLFLSFLGLGNSDFVLTMIYLAASMTAYWITRWIVRGFGGRAMLDD